MTELARTQTPEAEPERVTRGERGKILGSYCDARGAGREVVCVGGAAGSRLVIDRVRGWGADARLVAHLGADEPAENARIVAAMYVADRDGRFCRRVVRADFAAEPFQPLESPSELDEERDQDRLVDGEGRAYGLRLMGAAASVAELRWSRRSCGAEDGAVELVRLRQVVGELETYAPLAITRRAIARHRLDPRVSVATLSCEAKRLAESPVVLNRGLREAVLEALETQGVSMSEIAIRCGRVKRDQSGNESGETSWLGRRIGTLPESRSERPTPWVHSAVLALIAREGLAVAPREVELP